MTDKELSFEERLKASMIAGLEELKKQRPMKDRFKAIFSKFREAVEKVHEGFTIYVQIRLGTHDYRLILTKNDKGCVNGWAPLNDRDGLELFHIYRSHELEKFYVVPRHLNCYEDFEANIGPYGIDEVQGAMLEALGEMSSIMCEFVEFKRIEAREIEK